MSKPEFKFLASVEYPDGEVHWVSNKTFEEAVDWLVDNASSGDRIFIDRLLPDNGLVSVFSAELDAVSAFMWHMIKVPHNSKKGRK